MLRFITSLVLVAFWAGLSAQINSLPTIDDPQDADRIFTYTRDFSAAFRLDTLKSYFQAGGKFIDTVYTDLTGDTLVFEFTDGTSYLLGGVQGEDGAQGIQGPQGDPGPTGATGPQGDPASNYWSLSSGNVFRSSGKVGIGKAPTFEELEVYSSGFPEIALNSNRNGDGSGIGRFGFYAKDSGGSVGRYGGFRMDIEENQAGNETGKLFFEMMQDGSYNKSLVLVDGKLGLNEEDPDYTLHVAGSAKINDDVVLGSAASQIKEVTSKVTILKDVYHFDPTSSTPGFLVINLPDGVAETRSYYFEVQIRGYQYGNNAGFESTITGYFYTPTNTVYNSGKSSIGIPGGIRPCRNPNNPERLSIALGDGTFGFANYRRIEVTRMVFDPNVSTEYNMWDEWSNQIVTSPDFNEQGEKTNDRSPFSSAGISKSDNDIKTYHNVVCQSGDEGAGGFVVLEIPTQFSEYYTGELFITPYNTSELVGTTARVNFSMINKFSGLNARSAVVLGDFGSNVVQFGEDVPNDKTYIILGDGTDSWSSTSIFCLDRFTANGLGAGNYGSANFKIYRSPDLSFIPNVGSADILTIDKDALYPYEAGLYYGDGDVPLNTRASGQSYPGSAVGDTRLEFGKFYQAGYNNRLYALDRIGYGIDLKAKVNGSGDLIESYLTISDRSQFGGLHYTGKDILTLQSSGFAERGFSFEGGEFDYVFGPNASDRYELGAMELPDDGPATLVTTTNGETDWNTAEMIYDLENNQTYSLFPAGGFLNASIGTVPLESGLYEFKIVLYYTTSTTALDVRFNTSGTSISGSFLSGVSGNTSNLTNTTEIGLNTATSERREIVTGYFTATANGSLNIQFKVDSGTAVLVAGSHLNIKKIR